VSAAEIDGECLYRRNPLLSAEPWLLRRRIRPNLVKRRVFAKEPEQLALFRRIDAKLLAMIGNIVIAGTRDVHLSVVHVLHGYFLLCRDNA
jgi:hypothetical protein